MASGPQGSSIENCDLLVAGSGAGRYPSGGITLGPAMTFGYIAAHHAAGTVEPTRR